MILGVFGPRDKPLGPEGRIAKVKREYYSNYAYVSDVLSGYDATKIISGGGYGVEQLAIRYAVQHGIAHNIIPPLIAINGEDAWRVRNRDILLNVEVGLLLWDGRDTYYRELLAEAVDLKKPMHLLPAE